MKKLGFAIFAVVACYLLIGAFFPNAFNYALTAGTYKVPYAYLGLGGLFVLTYRSVK